MQNYLKRFLVWFFKDVFALTFMTISIVLLTLTLIFRVNPAEGSVVNKAIVGTLFHKILLFTTMPAWIAGVTCGGDTIFLACLLMYFFQIIIYGFIEKGLKGLFCMWLYFCRRVS